MKPYRVVLTGRSAVQLTRKRGWRTPELVLTIRDDGEGDAQHQSQEHRGFIYTVDLEAEDAGAAIRRATAHARRIANQIALVHSAAVDTPLPQFAVDTNPQSLDRQLTQVFNTIPAPYEPRRSYHSSAYDSVFSCLDDLRQQALKKARRIDRALHFLASSYLEDDPIDQFEDAWVALETLDPLIRKKYSPPKYYQRECSECKADLHCKHCGVKIQASDSASGINHIITHLLGEEVGVAKTLRDKRIDIVHSRVPISKILQDIGFAVQLAQRAATVGVVDILDLPDEQKLEMLRPGLPLMGNTRIVANATLLNLPVDEMESEAQYPQLYIDRITLASPGPAVDQVGFAHARPTAVQPHIGIRNFSGEWELDEVQWPCTLDPEEEVPIQMVPVKIEANAASAD